MQKIKKAIAVRRIQKASTIGEKDVVNFEQKW